MKIVYYVIDKKIVLNVRTKLITEIDVINYVIIVLVELVITLVFVAIRHQIVKILHIQGQIALKNVVMNIIIVKNVIEIIFVLNAQMKQFTEKPVKIHANNVQMKKKKKDVI